MGGDGNEDPCDKVVEELKLGGNDEPNKPDGGDENQRFLTVKEVICEFFKNLLNHQ